MMWWVCGVCLFVPPRVSNQQYDYEDAINDYDTMVNDFMTNPSINGFHALDPYGWLLCLLRWLTTVIILRIEGPNAVNAYAKASVVYIALLQQLALLGAAAFYMHKSTSAAHTQHVSLSRQ